MRRDISKISVFPVHKRSWHCGKRGLIVHIVPVQIEACKSDFFCCEKCNYRIGCDSREVEMFFLFGQRWVSRGTLRFFPIP